MLLILLQGHPKYWIHYIFICYSYVCFFSHHTFYCLLLIARLSPSFVCDNYFIFQTCFHWSFSLFSLLISIRCLACSYIWNANVWYICSCTCAAETQAYCVGRREKTKRRIRGGKKSGDNFPQIFGRFLISWYLINSLCMLFYWLFVSLCWLCGKHGNWSRV